MHMKKHWKKLAAGTAIIATAAIWWNATA